MKLKDMLNNKKVMSVVAVFLVILILIGTSFALSIFEKSSDANLIKTGSISMHYTESSNVINITNALPMSDRDGEMQSNYFDFSITSDAKTNADDSVGITIPYDLIIEPKAIDSDKDALSPDQIKIFLTKIENGIEEPIIASTLLSNLELKETNYNLYSTENVHKNGSSAITTKYRLRAWIDYNVDAKDWNKSAKPKQYKFAINVNGRQKVVEPEPERPTNAADFAKLVGFDGLVKEEHPATTQLAATTDYRYTGANPDNYVRFNNELWRIIGIFDVDDGTGKLEQRIKLIRNESIGNIAWDRKSNTNYTNDWGKATLTTLLNTGDYWNRTGSYESTGLTKVSRLMIDDAKWYLGGVSGNGLITSQFYSFERGTEVYTGRSTSWTGKVGLMYSSDYGYATSGGTTTNRESCLTKGISSWDDTSDCANNDWLLVINNPWTLTPYSESSDRAFLVNSTGFVGNLSVNNASAIRPSLYLSSDISIIGGTGTESDPYTFLEPELPPTGAEKIASKVGTGGLVADEHPATTQTLATTAYRYTGANPDNYVSFNNELWRIIGVFDVDDGTGNIEKRLKIIRKDSIGKIAWNSNNINEWTTSPGKDLLNSGDYWNRTGSYVSSGLTEDAKLMIEDAKWYLGGAKGTHIASSEFYSYERGVEVYSGRSKSWIGKVGLMYPSDYGYATSGGLTTNRETCLTNKLYDWSDSSISNCKDNDWLHNDNNKDKDIPTWTITPQSKSYYFVYPLSAYGTIGSNAGYGAENPFYFVPSVYLSSDVKITGGSGTESSPYTLSK